VGQLLRYRTDNLPSGSTLQWDTGLARCALHHLFKLILQAIILCVLNWALVLF